MKNFLFLFVVICMLTTEHAHSQCFFKFISRASSASRKAFILSKLSQQIQRQKNQTVQLTSNLPLNPFATPADMSCLSSWPAGKIPTTFPFPSQEAVLPEPASHPKTFPADSLYVHEKIFPEPESYWPIVAPFPTL